MLLGSLSISLASKSGFAVAQRPRVVRVAQDVPSRAAIGASDAITVLKVDVNVDLGTSCRGHSAHTSLRNWGSVVMWSCESHLGFYI